MVRLTAAAMAALVILLGSFGLAMAADPSVTFGRPTAKATFNERVTFTQPVDLSAPIQRVELLITFPDAAGPTVIPIDAPRGSGERTLSYEFDLSNDGFLAPNTRLSARWRLTPAGEAATAETGPAVAVTYEDTRFDWRTARGKLVTVYWYEGGAAFGARALKIGEDAVESSSELLGVTETDPIDFYVYADRDAFYHALGPGTRENVGGQANADIRTMFALVTPDEIDQAWVDIVIPHELTHLVFDTAVKNAYHFPPRWLNEGVAEYQSEGYDAGYRASIEQGARDGTLIPLDGLTGQFPTTFDRFRLAYAESTAAVDYLVNTYGQDALVTLITSYADGLTDDEAFTKALGIDATAFGDAWLASVGAMAPTRYGPQPAAPGPVPAPWVGNPAPGTTAAPGATAAPGSPTGAPSATPAPGSSGSTDSASGIVALVVVLVVTVIAVGALLARRRRQDASEA